MLGLWIVGMVIGENAHKMIREKSGLAVIDMKVVIFNIITSYKGLGTGKNHHAKVLRDGANG